MNPDDDNFEAYEPHPPRVDTGHRRRRADYEGTPQNCAQHSENMAMIASDHTKVDTVNTKLNWVLVIASLCLGSIGILFLKVGSHAEIIAANTVAMTYNAETLKEHEEEIHELKNQNREIVVRMNGWDQAERFAHGTGVEKHHLEPGK